MYLANTTRPIAFSVNLLARLQPDLIGHADDGYLSDSHKARSQIGYMFICGGTAISWRYTKQFIVVTSSNHAEIIAIHEASRECVWLRSMIHIIREKCGVKYDNLPTILYRDNSAYIAHLKGRFINGDRTKHILPKFFYIYELQKNDDINVQQIRSTDNVTDLFTKSSPITTFKKMLHKIEMQRIRNHLVCFTLFVVSCSDGALLTASYRLENDNEWNISSLNYPFFENGFRVLAIGRRIYVIGRAVMLRCDTWTGKVVELHGPVNLRKKFAAAVVGGKIYVAGGSAGATAVEEYDPKSEKWRVVCNAPRKRYGCVGASIDGVFYIIGGLKLGSASGNQSARGYPSSMDSYDTVNGVWLKPRSVPGGGCIVAAAATAAGEIYILSSHAVELSFWKFNGVRKSSGFGEWHRIKSPPLPAQVRLDSTVRFSCEAIGEKVVLVQVNGCIDDLLRRSGRPERGMKEGLVLVYDCAVGEWSRGVDLPEVIRRSACVCVEC
ncbi:F-box/kelch-repeat protein [Capsicum chinense]|nr:F-box/kelch-repeat protein [Capsicum chinense]